MPIYEYRCPNGHHFERFQAMTAPAPEKCDVCGAAPVELVLYPVAIHYKGSGFYTTDYGKGKPPKKDGDSGSSGGEGGKSEGGKSEGGKSEGGKSEGGKSEGGKSEGGKSDSKPTEKKAAASD